jgi:putative CocE/NonD family hydrolase
MPGFGPSETASMRTRDGVRLDADIYRPDAQGEFPVLLMRQPYGRRIASTICYAHPAWYAAQGYIVVIQDVRGRGTSEGVFRTFEHEAEDGADTVAWAASLPGSTGAVGMYGFSYQGSDQLLAAGAGASALKAVAPAMIGWDMRRDWAYENGAFCLAAGLGWAIQLAAEGARLAGDTASFQALHQASRSLPVGETVPARPAIIERHRDLTHYFDWLDQPEDSDYWGRISPDSHADRLVASGPAALFIGGWYDTHLPGTLAAYRAYEAAGKVPCRLVIGPWGHFPWGRRVGTTDFGPDAIGDIDRMQIAWFDRWLKGREIEDGPAVDLFDMGAKHWRGFAAWPDHRMIWRLGGDGRAALDERSGTIDPAPSPTDGIEYLVHDPWRPVPSVGGPYGTPGGAVDRSLVEARPDVLTFTSKPLSAPLTLAGSVEASLSVAVDAPSFDLSCVLSLVRPDGTSFNLTEGYCHVRQTPSDGQVAVAMRATCATISPGECVRLSIAGAAFPAYPVNPGTGEDPTKATLASARIITLGVRHGGEAGSRLVFSILPA